MVFEELEVAAEVLEDDGGGGIQVGAVVDTGWTRGGGCVVGDFDVLEGGVSPRFWLLPKGGGEKREDRRRGGVRWKWTLPCHRSWTWTSWG